MTETADIKRALPALFDAFEAAAKAAEFDPEVEWLANSAARAIREARIRAGTFRRVNATTITDHENAGR